MAEPRPAILATRKFPEAVEARLVRDYAARLNPDDRPPAADEIVEAAAAVDGLLVAPGLRFDAELVARLPERVRVIATFSVGCDHVDLAACRRHGIRVTNTPDVLTEATADIAMLCLLGAARRAHEGQTMLRAGRWTGWAPTQLMGAELAGRRLGIVGMGRIGRAMARRAAAFGLAIHYHNRRRLPPEEEAGATFHDSLEGLLEVAHFLSLHCPVTEENRGMIDRDAIARLPAGAVVVNTARGSLIDDEALIEALRSGRVFAAGLDVFAGEPALHPGYLDLDNAFLLPHLGSATVETRNAMGFRCLDNLDAFFAGSAPPDAVV